MDPQNQSCLTNYSFTHFCFLWNEICSLFVNLKILHRLGHLNDLWYKTIFKLKEVLPVVKKDAAGSASFIAMWEEARWYKEHKMQSSLLLSVVHLTWSRCNEHGAIFTTPFFCLHENYISKIVCLVFWDRLDKA